MPRSAPSARAAKRWAGALCSRRLQPCLCAMPRSAAARKLRCSWWQLWSRLRVAHMLESLLPTCQACRCGVLSCKMQHFC